MMAVNFRTDPEELAIKCFITLWVNLKTFIIHHESKHE